MASLSQLLYYQVCSGQKKDVHKFPRLLQHLIINANNIFAFVIWVNLIYICSLFILGPITAAWLELVEVPVNLIISIIINYNVGNISNLSEGGIKVLPVLWKFYEQD